MDLLLSRFRNLTILLLVLFAQLVLLAFQVKSNQDVRLIRVWAVTAVTPVARLLEGLRSNTVRIVDTYLFLVNTKEENRQLEEQLGHLKLENQFLKSQLATADRARALVAFQARTPSRTVAARIIGTGAGGANSKVVFVDRGLPDGVQRGMAVITPDGIVGKVQAVYPTASQVVLVTDPGFAAGVISEKHHVQATLKGLGRAVCMVDYLQNEQRVDVGEWFYTSGDDRVFPRGLPAGKVVSVQPGKTFKEVFVEPTGLGKGLDEVLIVLEGVHQVIPEPQAGGGPVYIAPAPPSDEGTPSVEETTTPETAPGTEADRLREHYKKLGEAQGHVFGEGLPGSKAPDFNLKPGEPKAPAPSLSPEKQPAPAVSSPAGSNPAPPTQPSATPPESKPPVQKPASPGT